MAERRMFTKKVTDDDNFMALSASAQALYLHLSMAADDDGFCNQVSISMFKAHASVQDLQALLEKRYIYQFENGVIVIKHWRMANALRKDRYTATAFKEEMAKLKIKKNGSYTLGEDDCAVVRVKNEIEETDEPADDFRKEAYKRSSLPYSFDYKIRNAFTGKKCPICNAKMQANVDDAGVVTNNHVPTIQHNIPISKGGEHELGNISVICRQCNVSIQDNETGKLNADEVAETWEEIVGCRLVANCLPQDRIDKDSIEQVRLDKSVNTRARAKKPAEERHKYGEYENVLLSDAELEKLKAEFPYDWEQRIEALSAGIAAKGYKYKNFLAAIRNWAKRDAERGYNTGTQKPAQAKNKAAEQLDAFYDMAAEWASEGE